MTCKECPVKDKCIFNKKEKTECKGCCGSCELDCENPCYVCKSQSINYKDDPCFECCDKKCNFELA